MWIDGQLIIDNDGVHRPATRFGALRLVRGFHQIRVAYFQGPRDLLGLVLQVAASGEKFHIFSTNEFRPPRNPEDWSETAGITAKALPTVPPGAVQPDSSLTLAASVFSITSVAGAGLTGEFYRVPRKTPNLLLQKGMTPVGSFSSEAVGIPEQETCQRFLGRQGTKGPFALAYAGSIWVAHPGLYEFALHAEDGAVLSVDGQLIVDDDQRFDTDLPPITRFGTLSLCSGTHRLELLYIHSSKVRAKLGLEIALPDAPLRQFRSDDFKPPADAESLPESCSPD